MPSVNLHKFGSAAEPQRQIKKRVSKLLQAQVLIVSIGHN